MILLVLAGRGSERMGGDVVPATVHASGIGLLQLVFFHSFRHNSSSDCTKKNSKTYNKNQIRLTLLVSF